MMRVAKKDARGYLMGLLTGVRAARLVVAKPYADSTLHISCLQDRSAPGGANWFPVGRGTRRQPKWPGRNLLCGEGSGESVQSEVHCGPAVAKACVRYARPIAGAAQTVPAGFIPGRQPVHFAGFAGAMPTVGSLSICPKQGRTHADRVSVRARWGERRIRAGQRVAAEWARESNPLPRGTYRKSTLEEHCRRQRPCPEGSDLRGVGR